MDSNQKQTYGVGGRHMSYNFNIIEYEKINPEAQNLKKEKVTFVDATNP